MSSTEPSSPESGSGSDSPAPDALTAPVSPWRVAAISGLSICFLPALLFGISGAPSCIGFEEPTLRALEACPIAVSMLGSPITRSAVGMSCGNAETGDTSGEASWQFPVHGSRGSGSVSVDAVENESVWRVRRLELTVGDRTIDALFCGEIATPESVRPMRLNGTATVVVGTSGVAVNDACSIDIRRGEDPFPCRVEVRCGSRVIYGAGSTGWTQCGPDRQGSFTVRDRDGTANGGDPTLDLHVGHGEAILTDQTENGPWLVTIRFPPP
jgi:hypothetical protein